MACEHVTLPEGGHAIVCSSRRRCECGRPEMLLCDWIVPGKKSGTCDKPLCSRCSMSPAIGKDLCSTHWQAYQVWLADRAARRASSGGAPECAPLTDLDAPAVATTDVSAPEGRSSKPALAAAKPETVSP
jgi:hypothetical protein